MIRPLDEGRHRGLAAAPPAQDQAISLTDPAMVDQEPTADPGLARGSRKVFRISGRRSAHTRILFPQLRAPRQEAARLSRSKKPQERQHSKSLSEPPSKAFGHLARPLLRGRERQVQKSEAQMLRSPGLEPELWQPAQPSDRRSTGCLGSRRCQR